MRVKVDELAQPETEHPTKPGHYLDAFDFAKVFCDGVEIRHVTEFDTDEGWLECYPSDPNGMPKVNEDETALVPPVRMHGVITYELAE